MNNSLLKKVAALEVATFLQDGYSVLFEYPTIIMLRHRSNGNRIAVKLDVPRQSYGVWKNHKLVKTYEMRQS